MIQLMFFVYVEKTRQCDEGDTNVSRDCYIFSSLLIALLVICYRNINGGS